VGQPWWRWHFVLVFRGSNSGGRDSIATAEVVIGADFGGGEMKYDVRRIWLEVPHECRESASECTDVHAPDVRSCEHLLSLTDIPIEDMTAAVKLTRDSI
jgi:hypothetical protein